MQPTDCLPASLLSSWPQSPVLLLCSWTAVSWSNQMKLSMHWWMSSDSTRSLMQELVSRKWNLSLGLIFESADGSLLEWVCCTFLGCKAASKASLEATSRQCGPKPHCEWHMRRLQCLTIRGNHIASLPGMLNLFPHSILLNPAISWSLYPQTINVWQTSAHLSPTCHDSAIFPWPQNIRTTSGNPTSGPLLSLQMTQAQAVYLQQWTSLTNDDQAEGQADCDM